MDVKILFYKIRMLLLYVKENIIFDFYVFKVFKKDNNDFLNKVFFFLNNYMK